jgi:hypothetical protein
MEPSIKRDFTKKEDLEITTLISRVVLVGGANEK